MSRRSIGIDLGTTNCCVSTIDDGGQPVIIQNKFGGTTTPSMVSFVNDSEAGERPLVGEPAARMAVTNPANTVFGVKRLIGRRFDDPEVELLAATLPYRVEAAPNGDAAVMSGEMQFSPPEISAMVLAELRVIAEAHFEDTVTDAIITVPAHFDNEQRRATMDAAEIAGLRVLRLVNEPTAAALGYGAHRGGDQRFAICDLGGGTFDVSIVNVEDGVIEVISTHGDLFLGGDDIDRVIIEHLVAGVLAESDVDLTADATALQRLKLETQRAKHTLSDAKTTTIDLPYLATLHNGKPLNFKRTLRREELNQWAAPVVERLDNPCREAVARCGLRPQDIDAIILVGGMTRMPMVQSHVAKLFGRAPLKVVNPDEIVAVGAATQCAILEGKLGGVVLLDVTARALNIAVDGRLMPVIPRNATIPTRDHKIIATTHDSQRELTFDVYEGESATLVGNRHLGRFVCSGLPDAPAGEVLIIVDFTVDVDGILRVSASELGSGESPTLRMVARAGLRRSEVARLAAAAASG